MPRVGRVLLLALLVAGSVAPLRAQPAGAGASGRVTITYTLSRARKIASDQFAIWIEDETGRFVRTLYATGFVARRAGWKIRPAATPTWVATAGVKDTPQNAIDAVSGATPPSGTHTAAWDLTDAQGRTVAPGTYRYRIEGNISWANTVLWTGTIRLGGAREASSPSAVWSPPEGEKLGSLISAVSALYEPAD